MCDAFKSYHDESFDTKEYCYHFTTSDSAMKIIDTNSLKLSDPANTNDTNEEKANLTFVGPNSGNDQEYYDVVRDLRSPVRMLCVSRDGRRTRKPDFPKDDDRYFTEKTHRGFSNPKMWSEYGEKNNGVCFIFNEKKLRVLIASHMKCQLIAAKYVKYKNKYDPYKMHYDRVKGLKSDKTNHKSIGALTASRFLKDNKEYMDYMYFCKNEDWANENEFRYLVVTDEPGDVFIPGILDCLEGIVVGEKIAGERLKAIKLLIANLLQKNLIKNDIPIRKISYRNGTYLNKV